jgi:hypothetical protein
MKRFKIIYIILFVITLGCGEEFLDINEDPLAVTEGNMAQQLTQSELSISSSFGYGGAGLNILISGIMHHTVSFRSDKYDISGAQYSTTTSWNDLYANALMDFNDIIAIGEETDNLIYAGIAKILKAYTYSMMVDVWGDIPFSEASEITEFDNPNFDDDKAIYQALFPLIDEAIADLSNTDAANELVPGDDDVFYGGNVDNWITFANSLKLKLYNQARLVDDVYNASEVNTLIEGDIISSSSQDFQCSYHNIANPVARNPGFTTEYDAEYIEYNISPWIYELMMGYNPNRFSGISDPRIPYYWFNPIADGSDPVNEPEYRDNFFISVIFASDGTNHNSDVNAESSLPGIYPFGGRYDDNQGGVIDPNTNIYGTGQAPNRLLTYFDVLFIRSELAHVGKTNENARNLLEQAVRASFAKIDEVVAGTGTNQQVPGISGTEEEENYIAAVLEEFDNEDAEGQLEIIMTQKWIAHFCSGSIDSYTDYRRTGYPVLYDPNTDVLQRGPEGHADYTSVSRNFPFSFPWSSDEITNNANSPEQKNQGTESARVFWDID